MALKRAVAPLLEAVGKLQGNRAPGICADVQDYFRDVGVLGAAAGCAVGRHMAN